jgi:phosphoesterase RecJ-like protein
MELSPKQQINELIKKSHKILIVGHSHAGGDVLGSMLALENVLTKNNKEVSLVCSEKIDDSLKFLPNINKIKNDITGGKDLIIRLNKDRFPVEKLSYNEENGYLNIVVSAKEVALDKSNLEFAQGVPKFDLIFVLDTPDVDKIDPIYDRFTEMFFETPIVNIDHHSGNEYFGTVNMVDLTATSTAEILVSIIESLGAGNFDADISTCLLTGIIADTASFKNTNTTPKSLTISAQMLAAGARQQEIIQNLYKTRPLNTLKLWGKVLSRIEYDKEHRLVWSTITQDDFKETGASVEEIHSVMDELLANAPGTDVVLLLAEHEPLKVSGKLKGLNGQDVLAIAEVFGGSGHAQAAGFDVNNKSLEQAISEVITKIKDVRSIQLGRKSPIEAPKPKTENIELPKEEVKPIIKNNNHLERPVTDEKLLTENELLSVEAVLDAESRKEPIKPLLNQIFDNTSSNTPAATSLPNDDSIEKALESIDSVIETSYKNELLENTPNIDIAEIETKEETLKRLSDVIKNHTPGGTFDESGNQSIDTKIWQ